MLPRGLIFHALVPLAPGMSIVVNSPSLRRNPCTFSRSDAHGRVVQNRPTISPPLLIPSGLVNTAPGGSIVVNAPLLSKKPCLPVIGSVGSRYVPTMSPRRLIAAARVKLAPGNQSP